MVDGSEIFSVYLNPLFAQKSGVGPCFVLWWADVILPSKVWRAVHWSVFESSEGIYYHWWFSLWQQLYKFLSFSIQKESSHGLYGLGTAFSVNFSWAILCDAIPSFSLSDQRDEHIVCHPSPAVTEAAAAFDNIPFQRLGENTFASVSVVSPPRGNYWGSSMWIPTQ